MSDLIAEDRRPGWVRFGQLDHQELSAEVASMMLTLWRERNPAQFGAVLAEAMTGTAPRAARGRNGGAR
jgi:hypothetical protein